MGEEEGGKGSFLTLGDCLSRQRAEMSRCHQLLGIAGGGDGDEDVGYEGDAALLGERRLDAFALVREVSDR